MGFLATAQGKIITVLVVIVLLLVGAVAYLAGRASTLTSATGTASHPSPSASPSPSPSPLISPFAPASPEPLGSSGALLKTGKGSDTGPGRGNGPGCGIWVDSGWTLGECGIVGVNGDSPEASIAYVTEHRDGTAGVQWRVFLMTTSAGEAYWHTRLFTGDDIGGAFTTIAVKPVDVTGGGRPDIVVGFRHNRTSGGGTVLDYDLVTRGAPTAAPAVVIHRQLGDGSAVLSGQHIEDYGNGPSGYTRSVIRFVSGAFAISSTTQVTAAQVPASDLP